MYEAALFGIIAYLLGSIPTAVWVGRLKYNIDVREHGSKNAGATNTFRVLGKKPGITVLLIDIIKGFVAVSLPTWFSLFPDENQIIDLQIVNAVCAVLGHVFPIYVGFKGGKGVATSLGVIIGLHPFASLICIGVFLTVFIVSHYVSLGAITAAIFFPILIQFLFDSPSIHLIIFSYLLSATVIIAHHKNIKRLWKGEENKMNLFKK